MRSLLLLALCLGVGQARAARKPESCAAKVDARSSFASRFRKLEDQRLPLEVVRAYPDILALTGQVDASPFGIAMANLDKELASERLFGVTHPEFDRTIAGLLVFKWLLNGEYDRLVAVQPEATRLSRARFDEIRAYVRKVVTDDESLDAMITSMVINDLGKAKDFVARTRELTGVMDVDHDNVLLAALEKDERVAPSYAWLSPHYREVIRKGLAAKFNLGQFVQAENVPFSLEGMRQLMSDPESLDFFLVHALIDFAGVAGHKTQRGSLLLDEPKATGYLTGIAALRGLGEGCSTQEVYDRFLAAKARTFGLDLNGERATVRLATMLGLTGAEDAARVRQALGALPANTRAILEREMNLSGYEGQPAILIYYAPAIVSNVRAALGGLTPEALSIGFTTLARLYHQARATRPIGAGVFTLMAKSVAELAGQDPRALAARAFTLNPVGRGAEVSLSEIPTLDKKSFPALGSLSALPGYHLGLVGIGGGSDGVQAAILGLMLKQVGKQIPFVISVRTVHSEGEARTVHNHGGEITAGVFRITPETTGSSRFLESRMAEVAETFLVLDAQDGRLADQIRAVLLVTGGADHLVAVDTGGDSLYDEMAVSTSAATPDQDRRVLSALPSVGLPTMTAVIAPGVDIPSNANEILKRAQAKFLEPTAEQALMALGQYRAWRMDGSDETAFGKTALAWQAALHSELGLRVLPIPTARVLDARNPWGPFLHVTETMRGMFFMNLPDHLRAIGASVQWRLKPEDERKLLEMTYTGAVESVLRTWKVTTIDTMRAMTLTNPYDQAQTVTLAYTHPGARMPTVTPEEARELVKALREGRSYVFAHARESLARVRGLTPEERSQILSRRISLKRVLSLKGYESKAIKTGKVFEYGDGWYAADWVFVFTSPGGEFTITDAPDFNPYTEGELDAIAYAMRDGRDLITERAVQALLPESEIIPGDNPRSRPPPR